MARKKIINVGLIGCGGNMRGAHLPRIARARGVKLVAACDPFASATEALVEKWGKPLAVYTDYKKMLKNEDLTALLISTPHNQHYEQARYAMNRGLHVLLEKPLTIKAAHAKSLLELSKKKRRVLHVAYQRHHLAAYRWVREQVKKGTIGRLRSVVGYVTQNWGSIRGWRLDPVASGGGMFMDTGSHLVAAMFFTSGLGVREVTALLDNAGKKVDINTSVGIRFSTGAIGSLTFVGNASRHDEALTLHGDAGCIVIHQHGWSIRKFVLNNDPVALPKSLKDENPDGEFFKWIGGAKGYERPTYALEVARLTEAVYKSAKTRKPVKVTR